ncbi:MAG: hypothetical protein ABI920_12280 [Casimicrobiaceae bacterium]
MPSKQAKKPSTIQVPLIVATMPQRDRAGGELQTGTLARVLGYEKIDKSLDDLRSDIGKLSETVSVIADTIQTKQGTGFVVTTIEVGVGINAKGSIGIVTAGVEASIKLKLERK